MHTKNLLHAIAALFLFAGNTYSAEKDLVFFNLSLAGYCIGMTYEDASAIRPFHSVVDVSPPNVEPSYHAKIDHLYVDDVEMDLTINFVAEKVQKVLGKIHPSSLESMLRRFNIALGPGENESRVIINENGTENRQAVYRWDFPNANMFLVGLSSNSNYAIVSLVAKKEEKQSGWVKGEE
jgi:hypothetical protein